ncbi:aldo/keto reductase [Actinoplanes friuliensis]|uniref:Oxidoreductase n=1 Tax=Actinoplanes friuliensis DSM 7358 TaxID=1246995 RepID=U5W4N8_9ACTN|nr:aldo/keto reductase [Actinoplanes friuliensis]AGZ44079.1 oxidoreductase [Actinoplanes friuliensis DSM 7358]
MAKLLDRGRSPYGVLGLGGAPLGNFATAMSDEEAGRTVARAWERGIRYFDTAPHYGLGLSERRLGAALRDRPRSEFVVSTKVGRLIVPRHPPRTWDDDGFVVPGDLARRWDFSPEGVERSLSESLDRLGLDAVDILFAHDPDQAWDGAAREALASLARLRAAGVVSAIGIGTNSTDGLAPLISEGLVDVIMLANRYSLLDQEALETVLAPAHAAGVAVVAVGIFGTGLLASTTPAPGATYDYRPADTAVRERAGRIASICADHGVELPAAALAFPLLHPAVAAVAVGMRSPSEVDENVRRTGVDIPAGLWRDLVSAGLIPAGSSAPEQPDGADSTS